MADDVAPWVGDGLGKNRSEGAEPTQSTSWASILEAAGNSGISTELCSSQKVIRVRNRNECAFLCPRLSKSLAAP
jgi:hypothetical protein